MYDYSYTILCNFTTLDIWKKNSTSTMYELIVEMNTYIFESTLFNDLLKLKDKYIAPYDILLIKFLIRLMFF